MAASPSNGGSVSGSGSYPVGSAQTIAATPNSGWAFTRWNDDNTQSSRTVTVPSGGITYTATFTQNQTSGPVLSVDNTAFTPARMATAAASRSRTPAPAP